MRVFAFLLFLVSSWMATEASRCFEDMDRCLTRLKELMLSETEFWFGDDFYDKCSFDPSASITAACSNPGKGRSILARFMNVDTAAGLEQMVDNVQMANVEYNAPEGHYYGCGHMMEVPEVRGHQLDPLEITTLNSWSLDTPPKVTWKPKDQQTFYTVALWDVGYFYLHGFYINAQGGHMDSSFPLIPYNGPKNPSPHSNNYLFVVIEQTGFLSPATVGATLGGLLFQNEFQFKATSLLAALPGNWTVPVAVNLLTVVGDTYSVEFQKSQYVVDYCPWITSQLPGLYDILTAAGIPAMWSYKMEEGNPRPPMYAEHKPFLVGLNVAMTVEYSTQKMALESCCVKEHVMGTLFRVNPYSKKPAMPVVARVTPRVQLSPVNIIDRSQNLRDHFYTLMMVDMTDTFNKRFNMHWLVTNIPKADVMMGEERLPYFGPMPGDRDETRVYVYMLFEQESAVIDFALSDYMSWECRDYLKNRCNARVADLVSDQKLHLVGVTWFTAKQDAYTRKTIYTDLIPMPMVDICDGLPGFESPCPKWEICQHTNSGRAVFPGVTATLLATLLLISNLF